MEVRHESFQVEAFILQARKAGVAVVLADTPKYPMITNLTSDFVYFRLQDAKSEIETGNGTKNLQRRKMLAQSWGKGEEPEQLPLVAPRGSPRQSRDVFAHFINGAKKRPPAAAETMISTLEKC